VSDNPSRQEEMLVLVFLVHSLVIDNEQQRERERTVTARLMVLLDDGGVMNDNSTRALQWQRLVSEFFVPLLGGPAEAWTHANRVVADRLFEPVAWRRRVQAAPDYGSFERAYQVEWLGGMCELVGVGTPPEEECLRLARRAAAFITCRVQAAFPGAVDTIRTLHRQGYTLHMASGESSLDLVGYLQAVGVRECFGRLYGPDLIETLKEGPEYYERLFADLGIAPTDALVVDDSPRAIEWATQVGARTVLVGNSSLPRTGKTVHIGSLVELPAMLQRLD
jgi:HAD superfamily hydrolase (TIGR01509 family)